MNDPYAADGPAPGVGVAQRASGTSVFTVSARIDSERNSDGVVMPPATEKSHAAMEIVRSSFVLRIGTCVVATNRSSCDASVSSLVASSLYKKLASESSVGWSKRAVCCISIPNRLDSVFTNSTTAMESRPADISGAFMSMSVPMTSSTAAQTSSRALGRAEGTVQFLCGSADADALDTIYCFAGL